MTGKSWFYSVETWLELAGIHSGVELHSMTPKDEGIAIAISPTTFQDPYTPDAHSHRGARCPLSGHADLLVLVVISAVSEEMPIVFRVVRCYPEKYQPTSAQQSGC